MHMPLAMQGSREDVEPRESCGAFAVADMSVLP
jgi:hypothetical protein